MRAMLFRYSVSVLLTISWMAPAGCKESHAEDARDGKKYYVSPAGDDQNPGTETGPFATLQKGVDILKPGDTLIVEPGIYRQAVRIGEIYGDLGRPITIRARIPRTVFMVGSATLSAWTRAPGTQNTWQTAIGSPVSLVYERDTNREYIELADLDLVDEQAGTFACDAARNIICVHASDDAPAPGHVIEACVMPMAFDAYSGGPSNWMVSLRKHLVIEGFVISGYAKAGVHIMRGDSCEVRDCVVHHCGAGIFMHSSVRSAIRRCEAAWCYDRNDNEGGGIAFRGKSYDNVVEHCVAHDIVKYGIRHYGGGFLGCAITGNLAYRVGRCAIHTKGSLATNRYDADKFVPPVGNTPLRVSRNVALEPAHPHGCLFQCWGMTHNTAGSTMPGTMFYRPGAVSWKATQLCFDPVAVEEQRFVDPDNYDFRLQSDAPQRGRDMGAFGYDGNVFFVTTNGDDRADGTAMSQAWRDMNKALERIQPGQTLYVGAGRYSVAARVKPAGGVIAVRARGKGRVVFDGGGAGTGLQVEGPGRLELRGVRFCNYPGVAVDAGEGASLVVEKCVFEDNGAGVSVDSPARFHKSIFQRNRAALRGASSESMAIVYGCILLENGVAYDELGRVLSEFNCIGGGGTVQKRAGKAIDLETWRTASGQDRESCGLTPRFLDPAAGDYRLAADSPGRAQGYLWSPVGLEDISHHWFDGQGAPRFSNVRVNLATPTTANLTWQTLGARSTAWVRYGLLPEKMDLTIQRDSGQHLGSFHAVSLFDLKPATTYYYQVGSGPYRMMFANRMAEPMGAGGVTWDREIRRFTTPSGFVPKRRTLYVSKAGGDDANDGLSPERAFAGLGRASRAAEPGDRVVVSGNEYFGLLRPVNSGLPEAPIVFEAAEGERVELSGKRLRQPISVLILDKRHIIIRGFVFKEHCKMLQDDAGVGAQLMIGDSRDIRVERCLFDGRMYYMTSVYVFRSGDVHFRDNVLYTASNASGLLLGMNTGPVVFNHNTFYYAGTLHGSLAANAKVVFKNNIFGEKLRVKWRQPHFSVSDTATVLFDRNYYVFDGANEHRYALRLQMPGKPAVECRGADPLAQARQHGLETQGRVGHPPWAKAEIIETKSRTMRGVDPADRDLQPLEFGDFMLQSNAVCAGMAEDGGNPGAHIAPDK